VAAPEVLAAEAPEDLEAGVAVVEAVEEQEEDFNPSF